MKKIFLSKKGINIIKKNKEKIEKNLDIDIDIKQESLNELNKVIIKSRKEDSFIEYLALNILDALVSGFDINTALRLKDTDFILKKINIKSNVKSSRIRVIKGRIIGTKGKTKNLIEKLSECDITISDNIVSIIGRIENVEIADHAIRMLIRGSPQSKVYSFLEKSRSKLKEMTKENIEEMIEK